MNKIILLSLLTTSLLIADDLKTHTELSYSDTSGNTDTRAFAFEFTGEKALDRHHFALGASALYSKDNGVSSKNRWYVDFNYDYDLTEKWDLNYFIGYGQDKFSGFDYQFNTGPGVRYKWIQTDQHDLKVGGNILYSSDKVEFKGTNNYISWALGEEYAWQIVENLKFIQNLTFKSQFDDFDNYFVYSKTALESKITEMFAFGASYKVNYAHAPAPTKKSTDRTFLVSLIIDY